jgi:proline iminopeptidase
MAAPPPPNLMTSCRRVGLLIAAGALAGLPLHTGAQESRQGFVSLDDAQLFYEVVGDGPEPIVVVHGGPGLDHAYLRPGLDVLAGPGTLIYYDQRGVGRSVVDLVPGAVNLDRFVHDIDALREALGHERITVLGHSFGALIAIDYARRYPQRTRALILMNPVEPGSRFREETAERQRSLRTEEDVRELEELRRSDGFAARDPATLSQVYRVAYRQLLHDRELISELDLDLADSTARNGEDVARLLGSSFGAVDWWDRIARIETPTLVLHGRYDASPLAMSQALAEAFPVGTLQVLDTGHFPYVEDREALAAAVSGFFATLR